MNESQGIIMIITNNYSSYPEGSEKIMMLLDSLSALKKEQIAIYIMETDETYNRKRVNKLIDTLIKKNLINNIDEIIEYADCNNNTFEKNDNVFSAFWVLLHYAKDTINFCMAEYPFDIVFMHNGILSKIVVCSETDINEKMSFIKSMKIPRINCKYYFLLTEDTINELDDELYPEVPFSIITISGYSKNGVPKLIFHDVLLEKEDDSKEKEDTEELESEENSYEE